MPNTHADFDVLIVGGGAIGTSLALALATTSARVGLVESTANVALDKRALALSSASIHILHALGMSTVFEMYATPIQAIEVSEVKGFGLTQFNARDYGFAELGKIIEAGQLLQALREQLLQTKNITYLCPAVLQNVMPAQGGYRVVLASPGNEQEYRCRLLVAADGTESTIRKTLNIPVKLISGQQQAVITRIQLARDHGNIAYERFTEHGAIAALPLENKQCAMVWPVNSKLAKELANYSNAEFLETLQTIWGYRLGRIVSAAPPKIFAFSQLQAQEQIRAGLVLLGNAAHTLHPIAAQGLNLGLRDMAYLADQICHAIQNNLNPGSLTVLQQYLKNRSGDQQKTLLLSNGVKGLFGKEILPAMLGRNFGLIGLNIFQTAKKHFAHQAMGLVNPAASLWCAD
jgi:2-octaprenyl-6-methoxyphenol hydroxylase